MLFLTHMGPSYKEENKHSFLRPLYFLFLGEPFYYFLGTRHFSVLEGQGSICSTGAVNGGMVGSLDQTPADQVASLCL